MLKPKGGYTKEMPPEYFEKQKQVVAEHIKKQDVVITTALIPGRTAPILVTDEMVKSMPSGAVMRKEVVLVSGSGNCDAERRFHVYEQHPRFQTLEARAGP